MNSKNNAKSHKGLESKKIQKIHPSSNQKNHKIIPKKHYSTIIKPNQKIKKLKTKQNKNVLYKSKSQINNEDSSTNCLSGFNGKKINIEKNNAKNIQKNENNIIPFLIGKSRESEAESFFINFKLGEKDSYIESIIKNESKIDENDNIKKINLKNNFDYCKVNRDSGQNENDSLEIYDFNDENNVDDILKYFSNLSCNKSEKNNISNNLEDCNEEIFYKYGENEKLINDVKIFEVKNKFLI